MRRPLPRPGLLQIFKDQRTSDTLIFGCLAVACFGGGNCLVADLCWVFSVKMRRPLPRPGLLQIFKDQRTSDTLIFGCLAVDCFGGSNGLVADTCWVFSVKLQRPLLAWTLTAFQVSEDVCYVAFAVSCGPSPMERRKLLFSELSTCGFRPNYSTELRS